MSRIWDISDLTSFYASLSGVHDLVFSFFLQKSGQKLLQLSNSYLLPLPKQPLSSWIAGNNEINAGHQISSLSGNRHFLSKRKFYILKVWFLYLIHSRNLEKMATSMWQRCPWSCSSPDVDFANKTEVFPNVSVHKPN